MQGCRIPYLHPIRDLHSITSARVRIQNRLPDPSDTRSGVRQGYVYILVPALSCCAIDWIMRQCSDLVLFASNPDSGSDILCSYDAEATSSKLSGTANQLVEDEAAEHWPRPRPSFNGCTDCGFSFAVHLYRGSDVDPDGYSTLEMHRRLGIANSVMGQLDGV